MMNGKDMDRNGHGQLKVLFHFLCGGAQNDHENPSLESQVPVQELKLGPLEWEAEMPTVVSCTLMYR